MENVVAVGFVPAPAEGLGEGAGAAALVEDDDLRVRVAEPLGHQHVQQRARAAAGRAGDERVAEVALVQVESESGAAARLCVHQNRRVEVGVERGAGPDR